jgi:sarcosine/dimethylglycine N-methyltransferase
MSNDYSNAGNTARDYYNSSDADNFYFHVWGGEDIHVGIYDTPGISVAEASRLTVEKMMAHLPGLSTTSRVIDLGSGYGGAARYLASKKGCHVTCVNISEVENQRNQEMNRKAGLDPLIEVRDGSFENVPGQDNSFDYAWSPDAILHSGNREQVLQEIFRVLKPGGEFVFTDPMQAEGVSREELDPVLQRIHLETMGSFTFYAETSRKLGFEVVAMEDLTPHLIRHYQTIHDELVRRHEEISRVISTDYLERMKAGLLNWVQAGNNNRLRWGIIHLKKGG